jgi:uncharacterized membrane protein YjdF
MASCKLLYIIIFIFVILPHVGFLVVSAPCKLVNDPHVMLRDFKNPFDRMTHITYSIANINIYKYRANLVDLIFFEIYASWI